MIPHRWSIRRPAGHLSLCCGFLLTQVSCLNLGKLEMAPRIDLDFSQMFKERYPDPEMQFLQACTEAMETAAKESGAVGPQNLVRSLLMSFTYPRSMFPETYPDGVWSLELSNYTVSDKRLLRPPVGKEMRAGETHDTVRCVSTFARQRSDTIRQLTGELVATFETARDRNGNVEYQFVTVRVDGTFDDVTKKWSIDPKSVEALRNR